MKAQSYLMAVAAGVAACSAISWLFSIEAQKEWARRGRADTAALQSHHEIAAVREKPMQRSGPPKSPSVGSKSGVPTKAATKPCWEAFDYEKQIRRNPEL